jgi:glycosyltransferase involved in cell wall biosynthesis
VELERFAFRERRPLKPIFVTTRLLEPLYNVGCVLRAFARIQQRYPDAQLIVGGEGSMRKALERLAGDLHLRNVEFIGGVSFEHIPALHDSACIYLNAPNLDNMPASLIECFACGLPVVTTDAGGIPYIVIDERTGLLVSRNDHTAMAIAAIRLLEDPELASTIARQAWAECAKYSWERVREQWLGLYRDLAADADRR